MTPENRKRAEQIQQRRDAGAKWRTISDEMGISISLMNSLLIRYRNEIKQPARWHDGLASRIANHLIMNGIDSREECQRIFVDQEEGLLIRSGRVWLTGEREQRSYFIDQWHPSLTILSVNAIREWLGAPPLFTEEDAQHKAQWRQHAIKILESHGYTVIPPPENTDASH